MISVIVPVYKVEPYLRKCLDSIINQTYRELEIILIDDCSPDNCGAICEEYKARDDRIRVFHMPENRGLSAARNKGLDNAKGEFIGFVDSDDWIEPDMYEVLLKALEEKEADVVSCGVQSQPRHKLFRKGRKASTSLVIYEGNESALDALLKNKIGVGFWNKLYRTELFHTVRFPEGHNFEDTACMHLILEQCEKTVKIPARLYHYIRRQNTITTTYTADNLIDLVDSTIDRNRWFEEHYPKIGEANRTNQLLMIAKAIGRLWRWWYGCNPLDREKYKPRIEELVIFTRENMTREVTKSFPLYLRLSVLFMRHSNTFSFAVFYGLNKIAAKLGGGYD